MERIDLLVRALSGKETAPSSSKRTSLKRGMISQIQNM